MTRHPLTPLLTRAGYATEAVRTLMLVDGEPDERELINQELRAVGERLATLRTPALRRAALRLAAAVE